MVNKRQGAVTRRALRRPRFLRHDHPFSSACACGLRIDERREGGDGAPHPQRLSPPAARLRRAPAGRHAPVRGRRDSQGIPIIPSVLLAGTTPPAASEGECGRLFSPHARRDGGVNVDVRAPRTRPSGGAWSKAVESVGGTSNGIVGSTANGIRSHSTHAEGGDHPHGPLQLRLTEDQAAAAGAAPVEARDDARGQATPGR